MRWLSLFLSLAFAAPLAAAEPAALRVLLLGDPTSHHQPEAFSKVVTPALAKAGIDVTYVDDVAALTAERLAKYDVLAVFRDGGDLPPAQEAALMEWVEAGHGVVPIHYATHCFRNSAAYGKLVGGRFWKHETGTFRTRVVDAQHPAMVGYAPPETWDETYRHNELGDDLRVLMVRDRTPAEGGGSEPYTWTRQQGKGRVFYTALGHDARTWKSEGFQDLLARGIRYAAGRLTDPRNPKPFEFQESAEIPNYVPSPKWGTIGDPIRRMQKPLSPEESMKHMHTPAGFEVKLVASDPAIYRPICMNWDERGRLWIAETLDYPNEMQKPGEGRDRLVICEDTDGDGIMDKFTVFADKLSIPTGIAFARGGVIVAQAPDMLFLKSTRNDDHADKREVLFTGFGTKDTHSGPSNLRYGMDGWVYATSGYSGFDGIINERPVKFGQGIFRFTPDGKKLEFLGSTSNNTWGLGFDEGGTVFASTANNDHSVHLAVPNSTFERVKGWFDKGALSIADHKKFHPVTANVRQMDWHGGFTAAAGHALYTARLFPKDYWNQTAFVCEPTGHLIHLNRLVPEGSGYVARDGYNLFASDDEWTSPIMAEVGPDGAVWFIDWYNFIVQHNPTPQGFKTGKGNAYETPLRDKSHGRIYRILPIGAKVPAARDLSKVSTEELLKALEDDNMFWRLHAGRLLDEQDKVTTEQLAAFALDHLDHPAAVHALELLGSRYRRPDLPAPDRERLFLACTALKSPAVRRAACKNLPLDLRKTAEVAVKDTDPTVKLAALLQLGRVGSPFVSPVPTLEPLLTDPAVLRDHRLMQGMISAHAASSALPRLSAFKSADAAAVAAWVEPIRVLAAHQARSGAPELAKWLTAAADGHPRHVEAMLSGYAQNWQADAKLKDTPQLMAAVEKLLAGNLSLAGRGQLISMMRKGGLGERVAPLTGSMQKGLLARLTDEKTPEADRLTAARELIDFDASADNAAALAAQISPRAGVEYNRTLLDLIGRTTGDKVGQLVVTRWKEFTPALRPAALAMLIRRPAWVAPLLDAIEAGTIDRADLTVEQVQTLSTYPDKKLAERVAKVLAKSGGLPNADRQKVIDGMLHVTKKSGDVAQGKVVFEANCAKCHRHGDLGNTIGPDLTGMAVHEKSELIVHILDPSRSVEGNYRQFVVRTLEGTVVTGLLSSETKTAVEILDSENKKHVIPREDIEELVASKLSLMPEGFEKLGDEPLTNLLSFLTARDKYLPLPLAKAATISSARGMFIDPKGDAERLIFPKWGIVRFEGIPFQVIDPRDGTMPNVIELFSRSGAVARTMPRRAEVPVNAPAKAVHILGGIGGWTYPYNRDKTVSMIVRFHYVGGKTEDHNLENGVHMADYISVNEVPGSKLAFKVRNQQVRYLKLTPGSADKIAKIEFLKGTDDTAPVVVAVTLEGE